MTVEHKSPQAFNPAEPGTPEQEWRDFLHKMPKWYPIEEKLLVIAPHPDDEILGAGGLIHAWAESGRGVSVLSVTDGEAADPSIKGLDWVRRTELRDALGTLATSHIGVQHAGLPDGKVSAHETRLRAVISEAVTPDTLLIAPYEFDRHPDHEVVGRVCREIAHEARIALASYPVWTWHHTAPAAVSRLRWVRFPLSAAARRAKARALQRFVSQLNPPAGQPIIPLHVLDYFLRPFEAFVL
jgi:LmbE family N-acetylglucosaminyl deacetylase